MTVARTADDLPRYHGKLLIVDDVLYVFGFNYTKMDIEKSRSFGIMTRDKRLVKEACSLFEADEPGSPIAESRSFRGQPRDLPGTADRIHRQAKKQLLIYDVQVSDNLIQRVLLDRIRAGVEVRVIGKMEKISSGVECRKLLDLRLHVRAIVRDGTRASWAVRVCGSWSSTGVAKSV